MNDIIRLQDQYYIAVNSTYADDRVQVLNHTNTFGIFDRWGDIHQLGEEIQGLYHNGSRHLCQLELRINNKRPLLLSSSVKAENELLSVDLTNPILEDNNRKKLDKGTIYIGRSKYLRDGICAEQIGLCNYGNETYQFNLSLHFNGDFKDIFEVRGIDRVKRGEVFEIKHSSEHELRLSYRGLDNEIRTTKIWFSRKPDGWEHHSKATFKIAIEPHQRINFDYTVYCLAGSEQKEHIDYAAGRKLLKKERKEEDRIIANITTTNEQFNQWITRSRVDLLTLLAQTEHGRYPYAGVPWYNTIFGRDGIITALQTLWAAPEIARDVLLNLAHTQATEENAQQDATPGKIIHEMRSGEMVALGEIPFKRYYGTVDATPLFVVLAGNYYKRTADIETIKSIWKNIEAALEWMNHYGDLDGDSFVEYAHKSENGLTNQGWKDSFDSVSNENGSLALAPIALCEVQGYVYDAKRQAAILARRLGLHSLAETLERQAEELKMRFNNYFWDDALQGYVMALDGNKKPCRIASSNMGHALFSGIADEEKAARIVSRLLQSDMFSGWGIRTLSSKEKRYNPMSYHNGSVWPHDVSLITKGFSKYGFYRETLQLTSALFQTSLFIDQQRLPELFCGFEKRQGEGPTKYPVACSPQAWAVGAVYMMLDACLNISIDAEEKKVYFNKTHLPEGIKKISISRLKLGNEYADLEVHWHSNSTGVRVKTCPADWQVIAISENSE